MPVQPRGATRDLTQLRVRTEAGVVPVMALASVRRMPAPPMLTHHNGRRELSVLYRLSRDVPDTGPSRVAVEDQIAAAVQAVPRPRGFTIETPGQTEGTSWFRRILVPVVALVFLVLAITFESLTLPVLVLLALPLTVLGATWALVFAGMPLDMMAMLGALTLGGLTVNPAILLVDRMQQLVLEGGWSSGAAALASVRERTRPVLMTTATTVAALWPLALATGRENEIWPPFATIVIGGLITSTLLTLLIMPVGFILLRKLDLIFGRVGPWLVLAWLGTTVVAMSALIITDTVTSLFWQVGLSLLIGGALLAVVVLVFRPRDLPEPDRTQGPPRLDVRSLRKVYGLPGPLRATVRASQDFAQRVLDRGGRAFDPADARDHLVPLLLGAAGNRLSGFTDPVDLLAAGSVDGGGRRWSRGWCWRSGAPVARPTPPAPCSRGASRGGSPDSRRGSPSERSPGSPRWRRGSRVSRLKLDTWDRAYSHWSSRWDRRPDVAPAGRRAVPSMPAPPAGGCATHAVGGGGSRHGSAGSTCRRTRCLRWPASPSRSSAAW